MARVIGTLAAAMAPWDRPSPSIRADPSRPTSSSPTSPSPRLYRAASVLALELGIGNEDDYEPAPPELCAVVTVESKYDLLRLAGQKKRAEQDEQALRTRRRRPSFLPKELERMEAALKQEGAKVPAAGSASRTTQRRRSIVLQGQGVSIDEGSNKTVAASCSDHTHTASSIFATPLLPLTYLLTTPLVTSLTTLILQEGEQLRDALVQHAARLTDLFRQWDHWDAGGDGTVSKSEFRRAMVQVGLCVPRMEVGSLSLDS